MKTVNLTLPFDSKVLQITGSKKDKSIIGAIEFSKGIYETQVMTLLNKIVSPQSICLDIGANIGVISLTLSTLVKQGRVYSFEPSKDNFGYLAHNVIQNNANNNVTLFNFGIFNENCESEFSYIEEVAGCSFLSSSGVREGKVEIVKCVKLDSWVKENKITKIDFIKLDIEGAEIQAIKGGINTFKKFKPELIIEFNPGPIERFFSNNPKELYTLLADIYPEIYLIDDNPSSSNKLTKITKYSQLLKIIDEGKGWENLYCTAGNN